MESLISLIVWVGVFALIVSLMSKKKKKQKAAEEAKEMKQMAGRFMQAGREAAGRISQAARSADPDTLKQAHNEVVRTAEAFQRSSYSFKTKEQLKADRAAGHAALEDSGLQDEKHDWLARQLAEEQRAYREVSEMFEAKLSHLSSCAAENNRLDHVLHCPAKKLAQDSRNYG